MLAGTWPAWSPGLWHSCSFLQVLGTRNPLRTHEVHDSSAVSVVRSAWSRILAEIGLSHGDFSSGLAEESGSGYILLDHPSPDKFLRHVKGGTVCPLIPT